MSNTLVNKSGSWYVEGELKMHNAPQLLQHARNLFGQGKLLRLDLSRVTCFDSSIFSLLLSLFREADRRAFDFRVCALPPGFFNQAEIYGCRELMLQLCNSAFPPRLVRQASACE